MTALDLFQPIEAPTDLLWPYLTTASGLSCWQADQVEGSLEQGEFCLRWPSLGARMDLSVKEVRATEHIVLAAGENVLRLELTRGGVRLVHSGLDEEDDLEGLRCSWRMALDLLRYGAESHPRIPRSVTWDFAAVRMGRELLHYYFTDPGGLAQWLGHVEAELEEGRTYRLSLDQMILEGRVRIAQPGRDVALTLEGQASYLVLRSLPGPGESRVAAVGLSMFQPAPDPRLTAELTRGVDRLRALAEGLVVH